MPTIDTQSWWDSIDEQEKIKIIRERENATPENICDRISELMKTKWTSSDKERFKRYTHLAVNSAWN